MCLRVYRMWAYVEGYDICSVQHTVRRALSTERPEITPRRIADGLGVGAMSISRVSRVSTITRTATGNGRQVSMRAARVVVSPMATLGGSSQSRYHSCDDIVELEVSSARHSVRPPAARDSSPRTPEEAPPPPAARPMAMEAAGEPANQPRHGRRAARRTELQHRMEEVLQEYKDVFFPATIAIRRPQPAERSRRGSVFTKWAANGASSQREAADRWTALSEASRLTAAASARSPAVSTATRSTAVSAGTRETRTSCDTRG